MHYVSVLCITQPSLHVGGQWTTYYVSVSRIKRRKPAGEGYGLRITYPYHVSSAESPPERATMYYVLRIRIMYSSAATLRRVVCESWGGVRSAACSPNNPPPLLAQTLTSRCR